MKTTLTFDPREYDYGAATGAIRSILAEWTEIDWFEPNDAAAHQCMQLFREHQRLAHALAPELFPNDVDVRVVTGDPGDFTSWCQRVRAPAGWDWKLSALKELSSRHAHIHGWSPELEVGDRSPVPPRPGDLFFVLGTKQVMWNSIVPSLDAALPRDAFGEAANFYFGYARNDALDCMKWQLAARSADMTTNPFLPLLLCYQAGAYPFSLGRTEVVMFRFGSSRRS